MTLNINQSSCKLDNQLLLLYHQDVNDNAPKFDKLLYTGTISESAVGGTSVVIVTATDNDSTKPNNEFLYRIDSGAGDKFRINFQTGEITVEIGAKLDREDKASYTLNVSATDRGATSETGQCLVEITVTDVNDEPPQFNALEYTQNINQTIGTTIPLRINVKKYILFVKKYILVCWFPGLLVCRFPSVSWFAGLLVSWFAGFLACPGLLVSWFAGLLVS